ncbi:MAG: secretin N-terminal domain-containing protein, partial [Pseudomonadota bacterium]
MTIVYDEGFKSRKVNVAFQQMSFRDVLERLMTVYHCFYKPLDSRTILVANDGREKREEYEEQLLKTFYLHNADPAKTAANLKSMVDLSRVMVNPELKAITVRDSAEKLELARRLIEREDMRRAEVVVDLEILEFNRNRLAQFGLDFSSYGVGGAVALEPVTQFPSGTMIRGHMLGHIEVSDLLFSIPSVAYRLLRTDTHTRLIARPQLRCAEGETVSVKIGDRIPMPVTAFVSVLGGGGVPAQPIVSYQMEQVGLQVDLTPTVHLNQEVTLKAKFELTSVVREGTVTVPPTLGNRLVTSTIRLKDGETTLIAGLIREEDRKSRSGLPGISQVPVLGHLFASNNNSGATTDLALTIRPHIVRMAEIGEEERKAVWVGTERTLHISDEPPTFPKLSGDTTTAPPPVPQPPVPDVSRQPIAEPVLEASQPTSAVPETQPRKPQEEPGRQPGDQADRTATISIDPSDMSVPPGTPFTLLVLVRASSPVGSCSFQLTIDPAIFQIASL